MELGELSRAIGQRWSVIWPKVRKLEERKDAGQALSPVQESKLLESATQARSPNTHHVLRISLLTGMRSGEVTTLRWAQIDLFNRVITVGRAKTSSGTGRQIPMNQEPFSVLTRHVELFTKRFTETKPGSDQTDDDNEDGLEHHQEAGVHRVSTSRSEAHRSH